MKVRRLPILAAAVLGATLASACSAPRGPAAIGVVYGPGAGQDAGPSAARDNAPISASPRPVGAPYQGCGVSYTVQPNDTLSGIAQRCGVEMYELAEQNDLNQPFTLQAGQVLSLPGGQIHTVQRGENLYRIALSYGMTTEEMAALNDIPPPYTIHPGQQLRTSASVRTASVASPPPAAPPVAREPARPAARVEARAPNPSTSAPARPVDHSRSIAPAPGGAFVWPLDGEVLQSFGPQEGGRRSDGLKIAARVGDPVVAAASGQVIYAGDELQNFGQLVLIRHENGYVTAYAHNSVLRVAENAEVQAGDVIAEAGQTGSADRPMLHCEVRRNMSPIDPMEVLAPRS